MFIYVRSFIHGQEIYRGSRKQFAKVFFVLLLLRKIAQFASLFRIFFFLIRQKTIVQNAAAHGKRSKMIVYVMHMFYACIYKYFYFFPFIFG